MPEMLDLCGRSFRVHRRVEKTCVDVTPPMEPNRRFANNDVVTLQGMRCDGSGHDGCNRGCRIFWKEAWLRPSITSDATIDATSGATMPADEIALAELRARLKVKADGQHYFCQSTELIRATESFPGKMKPWLVRIALRQVRQKDRSALEIAKLFGRWLRLRIHRAMSGDEKLRGTQANGTPVAVLDLKPGELVRVKSFNEIVSTLDQKDTIAA